LDNPALSEPRAGLVVTRIAVGLLLIGTTLIVLQLFMMRLLTTHYWEDRIEMLRLVSVLLIGAILALSACGPMAAGYKKQRRKREANTVQKAQVLLTVRGYKPGKINGRLTGCTQDAIGDFQKKAGMPVTGSASEALLISLMDDAPVVKYIQDDSVRGPMVPDDQVLYRRGGYAFYRVPSKSKRPALGCIKEGKGFKSGRACEDLVARLVNSTIENNCG